MSFGLPLLELPCIKLIASRGLTSHLVKLNPIPASPVPGEISHVHFLLSEYFSPNIPVPEPKLYILPNSIDGGTISPALDFMRTGEEQEQRS